MKKSGLIFPTLVKFCPILSKRHGGTKYHCVETIQSVKSFKIRAAYNALCNLIPE